MSIRVYQGPHARRDRRRVILAIPVAFAVATVLLQILWVLADDRFWWTHAVVACFFLATASHALIHRGRTWAAGYLAITLAFGWLIELIGTNTGWPFGEYEYASTLSGRDVILLAGVPLIVPFAWAMMAYPALIAAQRIVGRAGRSLTIVTGAIALSAWDLFLDPQMVGEGWWTWANPDSLHLPGVEEIPVQNYLGWLLSTAVLMSLLVLLPRRRASNVLPLVMYAWMWLGGIIMNVFWMGEPWVALWGGLAMGAVVAAMTWRIALARP